MRFGILTTGVSEELRSLKSAAKLRGHTLDFIKTQAISISSFQKDAQIKKILNYDLIHYRSGLGTVGIKLLGDLAKFRKVIFINKSFHQDPLFINKLYQVAKVSDAGILTPKSYSKAKTSYEEISKLLGKKFIFKFGDGSQGVGVGLIQDKESFKQVPSYARGGNLFQEYISNHGDYRVYIIGHKAKALYKRIPQVGDFRSNLSRGAKLQKILDKKLSSKLKSMAEKISRILDLDIAGIDIVQGKKNSALYFLEANRSPGWKNVLKVTNVDIADEMIKYYEKRVQEKRGQ